jgi:serine/threonine-protein kinase
MDHQPGSSRSYPDSDTFAAIAAAFERLRALSGDRREPGLAALAPAVALAVRRLLELHDANSPVLQAPEQALGDELLHAFADATADPAQVPRTIGAFRLVRLLGQGGMGAVWLAERQAGDFQQQVAVKLLRLDAAAPELRERFRIERRILAGLKHPNIAALLDGGTTDDGLPFVVMEYVDGEHLLAHAEQRALAVPQRLELFCKVCDAVEHAHRNLVVHRDLKPGNILVTAQGEPKLLDFGIAKLLQPAPGDATPSLTLTGAMLLTPEYSSPEQVRGETVTTATDVYALGAILYELLTGRRAQPLQSRTPHELELIVCERDAPSPSAVLADPEVPLPAVGLPRARLQRLLQGDLDVIVQRALHKEPARRYGDAGELADDLRRHLRGLPVVARPDTFAYRAQKFVRRHRWQVAGALAFAALLVAATVTTAVQAARIAGERDTAQQKTAIATGIADFLVGLFEMAEPDPLRAEQLSARAVLDLGSQRIRHELTVDPRVRAGLLVAMGRAYTALGLFAAAGPLLDEADPAVGSDDALRATLLTARGLLHELREETAVAEPLLRQAIALWQQLGEPRGLARSQTALTHLLNDAGRTEEALALAEAAWQSTLRAVGSEHNDAAEALVVRAIVHGERGEFAAAEQLLGEAEALQQRLFAADHPAHARTLRARGHLYKTQGRYDDARSAYDRVLALDRRVLGDDHPDIDRDLFALAMLEDDVDNLERAESLLQEVLQRDLGRFGERHALVALDRGQIAILHSQRGDYATAEPMLIAALALQRELLPADHPELATTLNNLGVLYHRTRRYDDAEPCFRESLEIRQRIFPTDHPALLTSRNLMAVLMSSRGDFRGAEPLFREVLAARRRTLGDHDQTAGTLFSLASTVLSQGRAPEALELLAESVRIYRAVLPPGHVDLARPLALQAKVALDQGRAADAEPLLREALACRASLEPTHADRVFVERDLGRCLTRLGRYDEAETLLRSARSRCEQGVGLDHPLAQGVQRALDELAAARAGK